MRVFKNRAFARWTAKEGISDAALLEAVDEIGSGLVEANLGGHLYKKRVAVGGRGKSAGVRTILAYKSGDRAFFIYGFVKNARSNITANELKALKHYASVLIAMTGVQLQRALREGALIEVESDE